MPSTFPDAVKSYWQRKTPPALRRAVRSVRQALLDRPGELITVIVPFYRVEQYFEACLRSIAEQTHRDLQVLLIDDGSPDDSIKIAREYARADRRFRVVRQHNQGLGAARNTGLRYAKGSYVTFVDSDDELPRDALATLVAALRRSGSDFAIGTPRRLSGRRRWVPDWAGQVHARDRYGLRVAEFPDILKDVFVCNKLFRTDFFQQVVQRFPVGIRYEDQEPTARAFVAGRFDVLTAVTYDWRVREDGSSITQQKANPADLADRIAVKRRVRRILRDGADPATYTAWLAKAVGFDLRSYYEQVPRTDQAYWQALRDIAVDLAADLDTAGWQQIPIIDRLPALAALADRRDLVCRLVTRRSEYGWRVPTVSGPDGIRLDPGYDDELAAIVSDPARLRLAEADLGFVSRIDRIDWTGRVLRIAGHAYIAGLPADQLTDLRLELTTGGAGGPVLPVPLERVDDPLIDQESGDAWNSYSGAGFVGRIDTELLDDLRSRSPELDRWSLRATVAAHDVVRQGPLNRRDLRGSASRLPVCPLNEQGRWVAEFTAGDGLVLKPEQPPAVTLESLEIDDLTVRATVAGPANSALELTAPSLKRTLTVPCRPAAPAPDGTPRSTFEVTLPELADRKQRADEHVWNIRLIPGVDRRLRLIWRGGTDELDRLSPTHARLRAICSRIGTVRLLQNHWWAAVTEVSLDGDDLVVAGSISDPPAPEYRLRIAGSSAPTATVPAEVDPATGRFSGRVPLLTDYGRRLSSGGFSLRLAAVAADGSQTERWVRVAESLQTRFPLDLQSDTSAVRLSRTPKAAALWVKPRKPYRPDERGRLAQRRLHGIFLADRPVEPRHAVLFECFNGRSVGDSVLAIHQELLRRDLGLDLFWTVDDHGVQPPPGGTGLLIHSREWMEVLAGARFLVNNNNFPFYFRKQPHQTYLQTWHGTPLKRIGNDVPAQHLSLSYRDLMRREARFWDYLVAQNDFAAETLPRAFDYHGPVINTGYPRNDALVGPEAAERRLRVRRMFALRDSDTVVLYAPTWRDDVTRNNRYALVNHLDFDRLDQVLPKRPVFLVRGHANTAGSEVSLPKSVIDVTAYSDVNDLLLAADVLITDYSSVMFDFAVTRKPILLLTPDLATYRDSTRGFYLDFESTVPGPVCLDHAALERQLNALPTYFDRYGDRYDAFLARFAPRDDGHAAARVVDQVWAPAALRSPAPAGALD